MFRSMLHKLGYFHDLYKLLSCFGFKTHNSVFCEELFRSLDADILSSNDSLSLMLRQKKFELGIHRNVN